MRLGQLAKILALNVGIGVTDTIIFSPGLIGIEIGGASTAATAFGVTSILMSVAIFFVGNYTLLQTPDKIIATHELKTAEDCSNALEQNYSKKTFKKEITALLDQIKRIEEKKSTIKEILLQKFSSTEMSFAKFEGAVQDLENVFFLNIKSILNKLNAFDQEDYERTKKDAEVGASSDFIQSKLKIFQEYITFIQNSTEDNEQILLKLDQLLLELSKFHSLEEGELENTEAMKAIDDLIAKTKFYKG